MPGPWSVPHFMGAALFSYRPPSSPFQRHLPGKPAVELCAHLNFVIGVDSGRGRGGHRRGDTAENLN